MFKELFTEASKDYLNFLKSDEAKAIRKRIAKIYKDNPNGMETRMRKEYEANKAKKKLSEAKEPKSFYIRLPRPSSKKFTVTSDTNSNLVEINKKDYSITVDGKPILWVGEVPEWDSSWSWSDFDSKAGKKIEKMIQYLKTI